MNLRVPSRSGYMFATLLGVCAFGVYVRTLAPTVYTFDSAEFATGAYVLGIVHPTGYPLYLLLGKLFTLLPFGDVAFRVNLMSAVWGGVTAALLFLVCLRLTQRTVISASASLVFSFSHYYWPEAVVAETYTLNTTLLALLLLILLGGRLTPGRAAAAGLVVGLSFANHMSTILVLPALAFWFVAERPRSSAVIACLLLALLGLSLYLYFPWRYAADPPLNYAKTYFAVDLTTPGGSWSWITGETFRGFMLSYDLRELADETLRFAGWLWSNFVGAGVVLGIAGAAILFRQKRQEFGLLSLVFLTYSFFFVNYRVVDKDTMFNVSYLVWAVWVACGAAALETRFAQTGTLPKSLVPASMMLFALVTLMVNFDWADQSHNTQARQFATQLFQSVEPSSFVVTEWTWATPLEYLQIVEGQRPDVVIFDRGLDGLATWGRLRKQGISDSDAANRIRQGLALRIAAELRKRPVYMTEYDDALASTFAFILQDRFYRLEPKSPAEIPPDDALGFRNRGEDP